MNDTDDVVDWPTDTPLGAALDLFQQDLLCPICQDLAVNPHTASCGHSFCSLCIRKHCDKTINLTSSDRCPCCREKIDTADLRRNLALAGLAHKFRSLGKQLLTAVFQAEAPSSVPKSSKKVRVVNPNRGKPITNRIAQYQLHGASKEVVRRTIDEVTRDSRTKLRSDGSKEVLERRLRELIHLVNAQLGLPVDQALTLDEAVEQINYQEKASELAANPLRKKRPRSSEDIFKDLTERALQGKAKAEDQRLSPPSLQQLFALSAEERGPWRVAMSAKLNKPFYYNVATEVGQWTLPPDLASFLHPTTSESERGEDISPAQEATNDDSIPTDSLPSEEPTLEVQSESQGDRATGEDSDRPVFTQLTSSPVDLEALEADPVPSFLLASQTLEGSEPPVAALPSNPSAPSAEPPPASTQWICEVCTYINSTQLQAKCEMCETANPLHVAVPSKPTRSQRPPVTYNEDSLFKLSMSSQNSHNSGRKRPRK